MCLLLNKHINNCEVSMQNCSPFFKRVYFFSVCIAVAGIFLFIFITAILFLLYLATLPAVQGSFELSNLILATLAVCFIGFCFWFGNVFERICKWGYWALDIKFLKFIY